MFMEKIRKLKNKKGFTLVELIVVLVILVILMAMLMPALTGYITKAQNTKIQAACRTATVAAQATATELFATNATVKAKMDGSTNLYTDDTFKASMNAYLGTGTAATGGDLGTATITTVYANNKGAVTSVVVTEGSKTCTYTPTATNDNEKYAVTG